MISRCSNERLSGEKAKQPLCRLEMRLITSPSWIRLCIGSRI